MSGEEIRCPMLKVSISRLRCKMAVAEELKTWGSKEEAKKFNGHCPCSKYYKDENTGKVTAVLIEGEPIEEIISHVEPTPESFPLKKERKVGSGRKKGTKNTAISVRQSMKTPRPCTNCGRNMLIQGDGLCGACRSVRKTAELNELNTEEALADAKTRYNSKEKQPITKKPYTEIRLNFHHDNEVDMGMIKLLRDVARCCRRELSSQIMWILQKQKDAKARAPCVLASHID